MTRKHDPNLLSDGTDESPEVRALLAAGATEEIDYDFDRGLAAHLGAIGVVPGSSGTSPSAGASAKAAATGLSSKALLLIIGAPIAAVSAGLALSFGVLGGLGGPTGRAPSVAAITPGASTAEVVVGPSGAPGPALGNQATVGHEPSAAPLGVDVEAPLDAEKSTPPRGSHGERLRPALHPALGSDRSIAQRKPTEQATDSDPVSAPKVVADRRAESVSSSGSSVPTVTEPAIAAPTAASAAADRAEEAALEAAAQRRKESAEQAARVADQRLEREMTALAEAKHALSSDPARALSLAREGDREFPRGVFGEERRHILILALIQLGRLGEARRLAAPYLEQHPDSPFARRVRTALDAAQR